TLEQLGAVEDAEHDVGVADVDGQQHRAVPRFLGSWVPRFLGSWVPGFLGSCFYTQLTSPATRRSIRSPTRTSSAPRSSIPAVMPVCVPDAPCHVTRAPRLLGARSRQASRIASNRPSSRSA